MDNEQIEKKEEVVETPATAKEKKKKSVLKYILNITLILTATGLAVFFVNDSSLVPFPPAKIIATTLFLLSMVFSPSANIIPYN